MLKLEQTELRQALAELFSKYVDTSLEHCRRNFKTVVPLVPISQAMTICQILESLIPKARALLECQACQLSPMLN